MAQRYGDLYNVPPSKFKNDIDILFHNESESLVLEKVHSKFLKFILGVRSNSSNIACRDELGSYQFYIMLY